MNNAQSKFLLSKYHKNKSRFFRLTPYFFIILFAVASLPANAELHTQPIPSQGISAPQIESITNSLVQYAMTELDIPGLTIAASHQGRIVLSKGFGYRNIDSTDPNNWLPMEPWTRSRIGSNSKLLTTAALMKLIEDNPTQLNLNTPVYGKFGILDENVWWAAQRQGSRRRNPIVDMTIGQHGRVTTWYRDKKFTIGDARDLDRFRGPSEYYLPARYTPDDLIAIARGPNNDVWSWYRDGGVALGTASDLAAYNYWDKDTVKFSKRKLQIVGIAMNVNSWTTYTWYHDGTISVGTPFALAADGTSSYQLDDNTDRYDIVGMAMDADGLVNTWYSNETASRGVPTYLDVIDQRFDYERRSISGSIKRWQDWRRQTEIVHLLSHTSGMERSGNWDQAIIKYPQAKGTRDYQWSHRYILSTAPRLFQPGTDVAYSNHGMGLSGYLIERISGQYFDEYIAENLLSAIGLLSFNGLVPHWSVPFNPALDAVEYKKNKNGDFVSVEKHNTDSGKSGAGAYTGAARDVLRFLLAIDGNTNRPDVLQDDTIKNMAIRPFPASKYGLGWKITCGAGGSCTTHYRLSHDGATAGAVAWMVRFENYEVNGLILDDIQVVINTNTRAIKASDLSTLATNIAVFIQLFGTGNFDHSTG